MSQTEQDKPGLIPRQVQPENLESPINTLTTWVTPNHLFFTRSHLPYPNFSLESWSLTIDGEVERALSLRYEDLQGMPQVAKVVTIECSGNKRGLMEPPTSGEQWKMGAVGNAKWTGVPLNFIMDQVSVKNGAREIVFSGIDRGPRPDMPGEFDFARSLALDNSLLSECVLALKMNDEPLPFKHGFPVRLIVPGWYGMAQVKWLKRITVKNNAFKGPYQVVDYQYLTNEDDYRNAKPVAEMKVNSIITWPSKGERIYPGVHSICGLAWAGGSKINKVEVSVDNGATWFVVTASSPQPKELS